MSEKRMLTESDGMGNWWLKGVPWENVYEGSTITRKIYEKLYGALWKLKQYEELGLQPDKIEQMDELYREKCEEVARLTRDKKKGNDVSCKYNEDVLCRNETCSSCACEAAVAGYKEKIVEQLKKDIEDTKDTESGIAARWAYKGAIEIVMGKR